VRYFVTLRSSAFCILGLVCGLVGLIYLTNTATHFPHCLPGYVAHARHPRVYYKRAIPLLIIAAVALRVADRISKQALGDY
jgi:H+/Cl- antiporter ClcA